MKKKNIYIIISVVIVTLVVILLVISSNNKISPTEQFSLDKECRELANEFAVKNSVSHIGADTSWKVLRTKFYTKDNSCYAEFDKNIAFTNGNYISEYYIYNLSSNSDIDALTTSGYYSDESHILEWSDYYADASPEYFKNRKKYFDTDINY